MRTRKYRIECLADNHRTLRFYILRLLKYVLVICPLQAGVGCSQIENKPLDWRLNITDPKPGIFSLAVEEILSRNRIDSEDILSSILGHPLVFKDAWRDGLGRIFFHYVFAKATPELTAAEIFVSRLANSSKAEAYSEIRIRKYYAIGCLEFSKVLKLRPSSWIKSTGLGFYPPHVGYETAMQRGTHLIRISVGLEENNICVQSVNVSQVL